MALFPASPSNGATANVNGYQFTFNSTDNAWNRTQSFTGSLAANTINVSGNANVGNLGTVGLITATGNITGGNLIGVFANGNSNVNIPAANGNVNISAAGNANIVVVTGTGANITGTLNVSGVTTFSGVGQQILGDFSNATLASRTVFQSKTANTATDIPILPNGTAAGGSSLNTFNNSNIANSAYIVMGANSTVTRLYSATTGSATLLPLVFGMGASEVARFDTGGNLQFSGVGQRIQGDFSNATIASRTIVQDKATNSDTNFFVMPSGTNSNASIGVFNSSSNLGNVSFGSIGIDTSSFAIKTTVTGGGTQLPMTFYLNGAERARIDTSGIFYVGSAGSFYNTGLNAKGYFYSSGDGKALSVATNASAVGYTALAVARQSSDGQVIECWRGASVVGSVTVGASSTAFNTSSDYRLKDNPQPLTGSGAFIDALQPKTWTWKINGEIGTGFIAHEVAEVAPSSVFGEKDAVNEDGTPRHQAMEYGSAEFIAHIIAELQDLRRRFAQLETEVNNLKNS
jgi:Chaperone of endosialidase